MSPLFLVDLDVVSFELLLCLSLGFFRFWMVTFFFFICLDALVVTGFSLLVNLFLIWLSVVIIYVDQLNIIIVVIYFILVSSLLGGSEVSWSLKLCLSERCSFTLLKFFFSVDFKSSLSWLVGMEVMFDFIVFGK